MTWDFVSFWQNQLQRISARREGQRQSPVTQSDFPFRSFRETTAPLREKEITFILKFARRRKGGRKSGQEELVQDVKFPSAIRLAS